MEKLVVGITHNAYHVTDMKQALRFYCDCLGLQKVFELKHDDGSDWLIYLKICDRQFIELFHGGTQKRDIDWPKDQKAWASLTAEQGAVIQHEIATHLCFAVSSAQACVDRLHEFGYDTLNGMEPKMGKDFNIETFIQDPDGNLIELMEFSADALQLKEYRQA